MSELMWVKWYATILRQDLFAAEVAKAAPIALQYGATQYRVQVDNDDRYKITQMTWVPDHESWYAYWEGPEMIEFRSRWLGKYQIPITYSWVSEIAVGETGAGLSHGAGHDDGHGRGPDEDVDPNPNDRPAMSASDGF